MTPTPESVERFLRDAEETYIGAQMSRGELDSVVAFRRNAVQLIRLLWEQHQAELSWQNDPSDETAKRSDLADEAVNTFIAGLGKEGK